MEKLVGKQKRLCVMISGKGSNLFSIIKHTMKKNFPAKVVLVISDNPFAKGLIYAQKYNISFKIIKKKNIYLFEKNLFKILKKKKIDLICLAGFMKILSKDFVVKFHKKILNIHPSLLPKYKGLETHRRVLNNREKESGCTVHFVNKNLDSGKIILQSRVKIARQDTVKTLEKKILKREHLLYPRAIKKIILSNF